MMKTLPLLLFTLMAYVGTAPESVAATQVVFDFESIDVPNTPGSVLFDSPLVLNSGGLEIVISHESSIEFAVNSRSQLVWVDRYGSNALSAFNGVGGTSQLDSGAFILDFDRPLSAISVDMGDFGQDSDTLLLQAYSGSGGSGTLLGQDTGNIPNLSGFTFRNLTVSQSGIRSVRMIGGSAGVPNSVFYDNITATTAVPEPNPAIALAAALLGFVCVIRRRRKNC